MEGTNGHCGCNVLSMSSLVTQRTPFGGDFSYKVPYSKRSVYIFRIGGTGGSQTSKALRSVENTYTHTESRARSEVYFIFMKNGNIFKAFPHKSVYL